MDVHSKFRTFDSKNTIFDPSLNRVQFSSRGMAQVIARLSRNLSVVDAFLNLGDFSEIN